MKKHITPEIMEKVWKLHTNYVDEILISETLGISPASVKRIIKIMTAAQNGEDVDSLDGTNHRKQKNFAKQFFGITKKEEEIVDESKDVDILKQMDENNVATFMLKVTVLLEKQNELLERLCAELGVK